MSFYYTYSKEDFIPATFTLGRFNESAYITCKFNNEKWVSPSIFERLCGYKPHTQRDSRKEMKKAILNAVETMDNVPTKGFKFVSYGGNMYNINEFNNSSNVIMQDPRGFNFAITLNEFFELIKANGGNMTDNVLDNIECVYAWTDRGHWRYLMPTSSPNYAYASKRSRELKKAIDETVYLGKKDLVVGHVYHGSQNMPGIYMYMGEHDVFSNECQLYAFFKGSYDHLSEAISDRCDITSKKRQVFYRIGAFGYRRRYDDKFYEPYVCKPSVSKLILEECKDAASMSSTMYNSDKPCSFENVSEDMKRCLRFHKIDFAASTSFKPMSKELFAFIYDLCVYQHRHDYGSTDKNIRWPYEDCCYNHMFVGDDKMLYEVEITPKYGYSGIGNKVNYSTRVTMFDPTLADHSLPSYRNNIHGRKDACRTYNVKTYSNIGADFVYSTIRPQCRQVVLDNGEVLNEAVGSLFTHPYLVDVGYPSWGR